MPNSTVPMTGIAINVYHSTSSIEKSFYHATGYALALIFVLVLIDLRRYPADDCWPSACWRWDCRCSSH